MPDAAAQRITFDPAYESDVRAGAKTTTVRWGEAIVIGPSWLCFTQATLAGEVTRVRSHPAREITAAQAHAPAGTDMGEFTRQLRENHYPEMPEDAVLQVVTFRVVE